jgi:hypothetical protein
MQRFVRVALSGAVFVSLVSCGGGESPDSTQPTQQAQTGASARKAGIQKFGNAGKAGKTAQGASAAGKANKTYIVQLREPAAAAYGGGIRGFAATRPAAGDKFDAKAPAVVSYRGYLQSRQDAVLGKVGTAKKGHSYAYTFNGFSAQLTEAQANKLAALPEVLAITEDEVNKLDTASTPAFLGLTGRDGFWRENGRGENVVIGIVDSGVWPELKSFSDRKHLDRDAAGERHGGHGDRDLAYSRPRGWHGTCMTGEQFTADNCNNKLIGARFFNAGAGGDAVVKALFPYEYLSPRDADGHGTHTASTSGGNADVPATGPAAVFGKVSGIAPRARIAVYKACWGRDELEAGCYTSDTVAAIDQAVEDGVDVINYSISGTTTSFVNPVEQAFLRAADAGVFVAASAGNSGPTASTVAHPSPWITTVAAGTHNRTMVGSVTLGSGASFSGASAAAAALASAPLVNAADAGLPGADATALRLCFDASDNGGAAVLDPAKVAGKVVVCDRGTNNRVNKSLAVAAAGGVGMVLVNTSTNSLNADFHSVPTVHLQVTEGTAVKAYAAVAGGTAAISQATVDLTAPAPFTASFSSRGPSLAVQGNLLKPDIIAPGQDILAGVSPAAPGGLEYNLLSGTSMSSPHIAGIAALIREAHPRWSPMAVKSALMTTAGNVLDGDINSPEVIFSQGAGHVQPSRAVDPGLVFDSDFEDWLGFLCGSTQVPEAECTAAGVPVLNPSDLNVPSIAVANVPGAQTVTRRVTNVSRSFASYTASVSGLAGFEVRMQPRVLTLAPGQTKSFKVTITRTTAPLDAYSGGYLTLTGGTPWKWWGGSQQYKVRMPIVAKPQVFSAPETVSGTYQVKFGYSGPFAATARGLAAGATSTSTVATGGSYFASINVPAGTSLARFSLFDANVTPASDLDLWVYGPDGSLVAVSLGVTAEEEVNLVTPEPGTYTVEVYGYSVPGTGATFTLFDWEVGSGLHGNMTVTAPTAAVVGTTGTIGLTFTGLTAGTKYLGFVDYDAGDVDLQTGSTTILVNP